MKKLFIYASSLFFTTTCFAQKTDIAVGKATYEFTHIRDTANRGKPYKETMVLLLGRNASVYRSLTKQQQEETMVNQVTNQIKSAADPNHVNLTITGGGPVSGEEYYQYINDKKLYTEEQVINFYLIEEPLPAITWSIQKDTMTIGTLHAQKATTHFKGRNYTAWFCPDLPFHAGPWKLNGLPGLILEASDSKKEVMFKFDGFEDISNLNQSILPPVEDIKTTPKELAQLKEIRIKDPSGFIKAAQGGNNVRRKKVKSPFDGIDQSKIQSINVVKAPEIYPTVTNNPVELPEKK